MHSSQPMFSKEKWKRRNACTRCVYLWFCCVDNNGPTLKNRNILQPNSRARMTRYGYNTEVHGFGDKKWRYDDNIMWDAKFVIFLLRIPPLPMQWCGSGWLLSIIGKDHMSNKWQHDISELKSQKKYFIRHITWFN